MHRATVLRVRMTDDRRATDVAVAGRIDDCLKTAHRALQRYRLWLRWPVHVAFELSWLKWMLLL
jgi:hypothetical protein